MSTLIKKHSTNNLYNVSTGHHQFQPLSIELCSAEHSDHYTSWSQGTISVLEPVIVPICSLCFAGDKGEIYRTSKNCPRKSKAECVLFTCKSSSTRKCHIIVPGHG